VKFLERESTPQPSPARLPAERMVEQQQQQRLLHRHATPTFNPFSTSVLNPTLTPAVPVTDCTVQDARRPDPLHPLMRPISPARVPVFAPASDDSTDTPPPAVSGHDSASSSGRSTPSAPTAILRDLLQQ